MTPSKLSALLGAMAKPVLWSIALSIPALTPAAVNAQTPTADSTYLNALYSFLESRDPITYTMATQGMSPEDSVWAAQMFCQTFESGVAPADAFSLYTTSAIEQATAQGVTMTEDMAFAVGLYGGAVMNLGSAHYCPHHQSAVEQALQSL